MQLPWFQSGKSSQTRIYSNDCCFRCIAAEAIQPFRSVAVEFSAHNWGANREFALRAVRTGRY